MQGKFIKYIAGLGPMYRTTPLLKALNLQNISHVIDMNNLCLLKNVMKCNSGARKFYCLMLGNNNNNPKMLTTRVRNICEKWNINFLKSILSDECYRKGRKLMSQIRTYGACAVRTFMACEKDLTCYQIRGVL